MYDLIVFLPLLGFLVAGLFGRQIGDRNAELVTTILLGVCAFLSWIAFFSVGVFGHDDHAQIVPVANWLTSGKLHVDWALRIDTLTVVMLVVVTTVSCLVHVYSIGYMADDPHRPRFFAYLSLFTFAMLMLVTADNLVQMFFGWEGVGLASYLLIGFWYRKALGQCRGDQGFRRQPHRRFRFRAGHFPGLHADRFGDLRQRVRRGAGPCRQDDPCLRRRFRRADDHLPAAVHGRDGQVGAVPAAHLAARRDGGSDARLRPHSRRDHGDRRRVHGGALSPLFDLAPVALSVVTVVGATTAFFAATVGLVQNDIKRVIAYSTCSQLGYMFVGLGVGGYSLGIFHLFTHAFFKALLFLGAGSVITAMHHEQDMRKMGGLRKDIPFTYWMMLIGTLALTGVGIPFTSIGFAGFVSKDAIIEASYASQRPGAVYAFLCVVIAAAFTSFYSWRLVFMTFFGERGARDMDAHAHGHDDHGHGDHGADDHSHAHSHDDHGHGDHTPHESPRSCSSRSRCWRSARCSPASCSVTFSSAAGFEGFWKGALFLAPTTKSSRKWRPCPGWFRCLPFLMMLGGFALAYYMYIVQPSAPRALAEQNPILYRFLLNKWYFDETLRFPVRAPGVLDRTPVLEGRRRLHHRRAGA